MNSRSGSPMQQKKSSQRCREHGVRKLTDSLPSAGKNTRLRRAGQYTGSEREASLLGKKPDIFRVEGINEKIFLRHVIRFSEETKNAMIFCVNSVNVIKAKRAEGMTAGHAFAPYSAVIDDENGIPGMAGKTLITAFDDRKIADHRKRKIKAGGVYKIRAKFSKGDSILT